jgi:hypothetical protein
MKNTRERYLLRGDEQGFKKKGREKKEGKTSGRKK